MIQRIRHTKICTITDIDQRNRPFFLKQSAKANRLRIQAEDDGDTLFTDQPNTQPLQQPGTQRNNGRTSGTEYSHQM